MWDVKKMVVGEDMNRRWFRDSHDTQLCQRVSNICCGMYKSRNIKGDGYKRNQEWEDGEEKKGIKETRNCKRAPARISLITLYKKRREKRIRIERCQGIETRKKRRMFPKQRTSTFNVFQLRLVFRWR